MNYFGVSYHERCKQAAEIFLYYCTKGQIHFLTEHACRQRKKKERWGIFLLELDSEGDIHTLCKKMNKHYY